MTNKRVLVKFSGEALAGEAGHGIDTKILKYIAGEIKSLINAGIEVGIVIGGGNIIRGAKVGAAGWIDRATADSMGMLATIMNSIALEGAIEAHGTSARTLSAVAVPTICETYARQLASHHMQKGRIVVLAGGTGSPFFTTDTAAVLRAVELKCDAVLKATQVDGVYTADPNKDKTATRYDRLTHDDAIARDLKIMDTAAFALARENLLNILVGSAHGEGAITAILRGEAKSTLVTP